MPAVLSVATGCNSGDFYGPYGSISSPNYPGNYENMLNCYYNVIAESGGSSFTFIFNSFHVEEGDFVIVSILQYRCVLACCLKLEKQLHILVFCNLESYPLFLAPSVIKLDVSALTGHEQTVTQVKERLYRLIKKTLKKYFSWHSCNELFKAITVYFLDVQSIRPVQS